MLLTIDFMQLIIKIDYNWFHLSVIHKNIKQQIYEPIYLIWYEYTDVDRSGTNNDYNIFLIWYEDSDVDSSWTNNDYNIFYTRSIKWF